VALVGLTAGTRRGPIEEVNSMSTRRRRWLLAGLALALAAAAATLLVLALAEDPLEAAHRRVPLGADQEAVEAAVGGPADVVVIVQSEPAGAAVRHRLNWRHRDAALVVELDEDARSVGAVIQRPPSSSLWERVRAWLGF
jgi:hypothetical protein